MMPLSAKSKNIVAALIMALGLMVAGNVQASGDTETKVTEKQVCVTQYGGGTDCTTEKIEETVNRENVTHDTVKAGIEDVNFMALAIAAGVVGLSLMGAAKLTQRLYWLD
jgi:hypothetical protein